MVFSGPLLNRWLQLAKSPVHTIRMVCEDTDGEQSKTSQPAAGVMSEIALGEPDYRGIRITTGNSSLIGNSHELDRQPYCIWSHGP